MVCFWMTLGGVLVAGAFGVLVWAFCRANKCPACGRSGNANSLRDGNGRLNDFRCMHCGHEWTPDWVEDERRHERRR